MTARNLVIVESPAKTKSINKYLGSDYVVVASFGHVRDLPPKDGSVRPDENFEMSWQASDRSKKHVAEIVKLAKQSDTVYLATDPDREGEAISWHVTEILRDKKLLGKVELKRVTFNEITKTAVKEAFKHARDLDTNLIDAYLARRALDYLVGFSISPILWRKLPGAKSAGRVQSVALRLICERETEIEAFNTDEYWSIETLLKTSENKKFTARLSQVDGTKLKKLDIQNQEQADGLVARIKSSEFSVSEIERKQVKRNPYAPFITSTLQQEASRKLNFSATHTMRVAQKLYEGFDIGGDTVGLITYMRTDGITLSNDAIASSRELIKNKYGADFVPSSPRIYKSKSKNAQEAHEAIRPTDLFRQPKEMRSYLNDDEYRLYELIWKRTVASQMESARLDQVAVDIENKDKSLTLRANGSIIAFEGFLKLYKEDLDDRKSSDDDEKRLPPLHENDDLEKQEINPNQHFTQPPPRYTEASLVKKMEELGIGRPSTYASVLQVLRDRDYVVMEQKRFIPENRGRIVIHFLSNFFKKYVEYDFTAKLEEQLDEISDGKIEWKKVLADFWKDFSKAIADTKDLTITEVIDVLDKELEPILFPNRKENEDFRKCTKCEDGRVGLKLGKFGAFIGCSNYPTCKYTKQFMTADSGDDENGGITEIGNDPETGRPITLRTGPYGTYVQLDVDEEEELRLIKAHDEKYEKDEAERQAKQLEKGKKPLKPKRKTKAKVPKPKRMSLPAGVTPSEVDLKKALELLSLPREVGINPETGEMIKASIGRFGPYVVHQGKFKSIPASHDKTVLNINLEEAVELINKQTQGGFGVIKEVGEHPDKGMITLNRGRYGAYVKYGKINATIPKDISTEDITLEQAIELIKAKGSAPSKKAPAKKKTAKKAPAKKKAVAKKKKAAPKKAVKKE